ncbi:sigma 54-interacting transcriptional regulator, partial [candidate division TA06 bacterium]|nr:sigma 54-interacting transcriptional regulator [candidate division TA06 bacterium]
LFHQTHSQVHLKRKEIEKAFQSIEEGLVVAIKQKNEDDIGSSHRILGAVCAEIGENEKALENYSKSLEILEKASNRYELAQTLIALAHFHLSSWQKTHHTDSFQTACNYLKKAETIFRDLGAKGQLEKVHTTTAQLVFQLSSKTTPFGREDQLKTLYEASQVINSILDLKTLLRKVMDLVINLLKAERGVLLLKENGDLRVAAGKNMDNTTIRDASELSESILNQVSKEGTSIISTDACMDPRFQKRESVILNNIHSLLCVPLITQKQVIGTIYVDSRISSHLFTDEDQTFLISLANLIAVAIENARFHDRLRQESHHLRREVKDLFSNKKIIGTSKKMEDLRNLIEQAASSDSTVLIQGETGTGKELVARAIHYQGQRGSQNFIPLICGSVPEGLLESELFGHKKGSFTGATSDEGGIFEAATGGSIFLDEIGDAPLTVQVKLLRVLEEGEIRRVGEATPRRVDVRVICATNKNLAREVEEGRFRQDLFFRINVILISLPPLRERKEDIPLLAQHFLTLYNEKSGKELKGLTSEAMDYLLKYLWPGNVRELENYIERAVVIAEKETITPRDIYPALKIHQPASLSLTQSRMEAERSRIEEALARAGGNITRAAKELGLHRQQLQRVMKRLNLTREMFQNR